MEYSRQFTNQVMTPKNGYSFFSSFLGSFSGSSLSFDFSSDPTFELEPPTSPKGPKLFYRDVMRRAMLQEILMTCSFSFKNLSFVSSQGLL
jgi:hypothetical protein